MADAIHEAFPTLCAFLKDKGIDGDIETALSFAGNEPDDLGDAIQAECFELTEVMRLVAWVLFGYSDPVARGLENDLTAVVQAVGMASARAAYLDKFAANDRNTLEDTCYEIAVTAQACRFLDKGTIQLERPIPDPKKEPEHWKNSDVFGSFRSQPVRIEVTVLHEESPQAIHDELDALVRQARISSGFDLRFRHNPVDTKDAERVRSLIELLHEHHVKTGGATEEIDNIRFRWDKGAYFCDQQNAPIERLVFHRADEFPEAALLREITHACSVRAVTPKHILEDNPNPSDVVTFADVPDAPQKATVGTKIRQAIERKLEQCEAGAVNIIAFGIPHPMYDHDAEGALRGATVVTVQRLTDANGVRSVGPAQMSRDRKSPFVSDSLLSPDERAQFTKAYQKLSATWLLRLGAYARSELITNPNAAVPVPADLQNFFANTAPPSQSNSTPSTAVAARSTRSDAEPGDEVVGDYIAEDVVCICGTHAEAQRIMAELKTVFPRLDDVRSRLEELAQPDPAARTTQFTSPTCEEAVLQFVVDCGGYAEAETILAADEERSRQSSGSTASSGSPAVNSGEAGD